MKTQEIIELIASKTGVSKEDTLKVYETLLDTAKSKLALGDNLVVVGFGTFRIGNRAARKGINPRTGAIIDVAPRKVVTFKPSPSLKKLINETSEEEK